MKVRVIHQFRDINDLSIVYHVGEEHEFSEERALNLIEKEIAVRVEEPTEEHKEEVVEAENAEEATESDAQPEEVQEAEKAEEEQSEKAAQVRKQKKNKE